MEYQKACRAFKIIETVCYAANTKWFMCFGNVLHLIRDRSIEPDKDIDVGVFYENADEAVIIRGMKSWQYEVVSMTEHDITHKALNIGFAHKGNQDLPPVDFFFWFKHGRMRYHTYDIGMENKTRPSTYVFKGVPENLLPDAVTPAHFDSSIVKTCFGEWNKPYFNFQLPLPIKYGSLLDLWYPNWLVPKKQESIGRYTVKLSSCEAWEDNTNIEAQLKKSEEEYFEKLRTYH